jgi:hypothetical protein
MPYVSSIKASFELDYIQEADLLIARNASAYQLDHNSLATLALEGAGRCNVTRFEEDADGEWINCKYFSMDFKK